MPLPLLNRQQIADEYGLSVDYLKKLAQSGKGRRAGLPPAPPVVRLSARRIAYNRERFEAWLADPWSYAANDAERKRRGRPRKTD